MAPEGSTRSAEPIVIVDRVTVRYRSFEDRQLSLRERVAKRQLRRPARIIEALTDVSFTMDEGDSLGIIGPNGSGKSTLMTAMTGLIPIASGSIAVRSRPTLLGVGAALRRGLSGRRNITLGCLAAGMDPDEIDDRMDEIIEFSGLQDFIDLPMKTYSSGMRARLTFSIATARRPDILLVDEALAVGDEAFKNRCADRIQSIRDAAGGVIVVSHNMNEIKKSCNRALWLENGTLVMDGTPDEVIETYNESQQRRTADGTPVRRRARADREAGTGTRTAGLDVGRLPSS